MIMPPPIPRSPAARPAVRATCHEKVQREARLFLLRRGVTTAVHQRKLLELFGRELHVCVQVFVAESFTLLVELLTVEEEEKW
jgi:hypothetical protein